MAAVTVPLPSGLPSQEQINYKMKCDWLIKEKSSSA